MNDSTDRRERHRRFEDRRTALLLSLHEVLFDEPPGPARDASLLAKLREDFCVGRAALIRFDGPGATPRVEAASADEGAAPLTPRLDGAGASALFALHGRGTGALTLTKFRRPSAFPSDVWERLWEAELGAGFTALLSAELIVRRAPRSVLWLLLENTSREWNSHDRELAEEAGRLLGRAADRAAG
jgi:hypothetical protein